jgi:hypothetical protein
MTRKDGVFTLKLDEVASLAMGMSFALDSGVNTEHIGVWWAENGELWFRSVVAERLHRIERGRTIGSFSGARRSADHGSPATAATFIGPVMDPRSCGSRVETGAANS